MAVRLVDYDTIKGRVQRILEQRFPNNTAAFSFEKGYHGHLYVKIISEEFNGLSEEAKQRLIWDLLKQELGPDAQDIALAMTYGMDELP